MGSVCYDWIPVGTAWLVRLKSCGNDWVLCTLQFNFRRHTDKLKGGYSIALYCNCYMKNVSYATFIVR